MTLSHKNKINLRGRMYYTDDTPLVKTTSWGEDQIEFKIVTNRDTGKDDNGNKREPKANWMFVKVKGRHVNYMKAFLDQWVPNSTIELNGTLDVTNGKDNGQTYYNIIVSNENGHDIRLEEKYGGPKEQQFNQEQQFQQQPPQGMPVAPAMAPQSNPFPPTDIPGAASAPSWRW